MDSEKMGIAERKEREKRIRKQQIAEAAKKVFAERGFKGATMEDIARKAELSPATLYLYFKNKDELYASLNLTILEFLNKKLKALSTKKGLNPSQKLNGLKDVFYSLYKFDPFTLKFLLHLQTGDDLKNLSPEFLSQIKELSGKGIRAISEIFEDGINHGVFIDAHPMALADIVWAVFTGLAIWEDSKGIFDPKKDFLMRTLDLAIDVIGQGIIKDGPGTK